MPIFKGACTALITPFTEDGKTVDYESFKSIIDFQIENGISALVFLGTTGEPATLSHDEKIEIANFAVQYVNHRVPVIVGAGSNSTRTAIESSIEYEKIGADALLHVTPYYNKCTQKGLIEHFTQIADSINIPIIMYNVPGRTGVNMTPSTVKTLSAHKNIVAVKEASGNIEQIQEIASFCGEDFSLYSGDDALTFLSLSLGASGVISVASNPLPDIMSSLCESYFNGKLEDARKTQWKVNPLIKCLFCEVNPIPVKEAMSILGFCSNALRLPLTKMENENKNKLIDHLTNIIA